MDETKQPLLASTRMPSGFALWPSSASSPRRRTDVMKTLSGRGVPPVPRIGAIGDPSGASTQPLRLPVLLVNRSVMSVAVGSASGSTPDAVSAAGLKNEDAVTEYGPGKMLLKRKPASGSLVDVPASLNSRMPTAFGTRAVSATCAAIPSPVLSTTRPDTLPVGLTSLRSTTPISTSGESTAVPFATSVPRTDASW
jgi:hypothetical protein